MKKPLIICLTKPRLLKKKQESNHIPSSGSNKELEGLQPRFKAALQTISQNLSLKQCYPESCRFKFKATEWGEHERTALQTYESQERGNHSEFIQVVW